MKKVKIVHSHIFLIGYNYLSLFEIPKTILKFIGKQNIYTMWFKSYEPLTAARWPDYNYLSLFDIPKTILKCIGKQYIYTMWFKSYEPLTAARWPDFLCSQVTVIHYSQCLD